MLQPSLPFCFFNVQMQHMQQIHFTVTYTLIHCTISRLPRHSDIVLERVTIQQGIQKPRASRAVEWIGKLAANVSVGPFHLA
jgi:hypothetical protein